MRSVSYCGVQNIPPSPGLASSFALILDGLCKAVAARMARPGRHDRPTTWPLLMLVWVRLRRATARFASLVERAAAGSLPPPRPGTPRKTRRARPGPRLPGGFGWLCRLLPGEAACFGSQLQHLISQPEMAALLDADPQARRMLRPLCRMLAVPLPAALALPTSRASPKPATVTASTEPDPPADALLDEPSPRIGPIPWGLRDDFALA